VRHDSLIKRQEVKRFIAGDGLQIFAWDELCNWELGENIPALLVLAADVRIAR